MGNLIKITLVIATLIFVGWGLGSLRETQLNLELEQVQLKDTNAELKELQLEYDQLNFDLNEAINDDKRTEEQLKQLKQEKDQLESEKQRLEAELQAKLEREQKQYDVAVSKPTYATSGDWVAQCKAWAAEAGVTLNSWAIELIDRESNCDPTVWNTAGSGAYGIAQALPASKLPNGTATSPPDQIKWMETYVMNRYGSWEQAVYFHNLNNWY